MSSAHPPPARLPRWKRWLLASLALVALALVARLAIRSPGSEGSGTDASPSGSSSRATQNHPGPMSSNEGESPPEAAGSLVLSGLVTDAQGQPLEGVELVLRASALSSLDGPVFTSTDAEGRYRLASLPPGLYALFFRRERYLPHRVTEHVLSASGTLDVVLEPALLVSGRVVDEEGHPVPRAEVRLRPMVPPEYDGGKDWDDSVAQTGSDETGRFVLDAPDEGPWRLAASHRDYLYTEKEELPAPASEVELVLRAGAGLEVVVVDEEDRPVADATCTLVPDKPWPTGWEELARTDEQGRAVLSGLMGGRYLLMATPSWKVPFRLAEQRVELRERERRQVRLRFDEGLRLEGVVVDGKGKPVADAEVRMRPEVLLADRSKREDSPLHFHYRRLYDEWDGKAGQPARTGPDGRFVLRHLRPEPYRLSVLKLGYVMDAEAMGEAFLGEGGHRGLRVEPGADTPARLVLSYRGFVRGRVVGPGGQPLTEFEFNGQLLRSEDGTFELGVEHGGGLVLNFGAPGLAVNSRHVELTEGEDTELGDVVLEEGSPVLVRVVDAEGGGPVEKAVVQVWAEEDGKGYLTDVAERTGREGTARLLAVEPRWLVVRHEDYRETRVPLAPGQREVTVALRAGGVLQGWLRTDAGPVRHGKVYVYDSRGGLVHYLHVKDGWYSQRGLAPGRYVVRADSPPVPEPTVFRPREVDVPEDGVVEVDFQSEPRGSVLKVPVSEEVEEVRLVQGSWRPASVAEVLVGLLRSHPHEKEYERHDQGRDVFLFRGLTPGRYTLLAWRVRRDRLDLHQEEVEVKAGTEHTVRLQPRWRDLGDAGLRGRSMWGAP